MALQFFDVPLSTANLARCQNTIGPNTFYMLIQDALITNKPVSVVRMGDGDVIVNRFARSVSSDTLVRAPIAYCFLDQYAELDSHWLETFGCNLIPAGMLRERSIYAAEKCTYYAPQIMGMQNETWKVAEYYPLRERYVDNWFVRQWNQPMQEQLFRLAGHVLIIHGEEQVRKRVCARIETQGVHAEAIHMNHWNEAEAVIEQARQSQARLVLFAGGPANKYISPRIAESGKVVIDVGQALAKEWS